MFSSELTSVKTSASKSINVKGFKGAPFEGANFVFYDHAQPHWRNSNIK